MTGKSYLFRSVEVHRCFSAARLRFCAFFAIIATLMPLYVFPGGGWVKNDLKVEVPGMFVQTWSAVQVDAGQNYTEMFFEIVPNDLVFTSAGERYLADYMVDIYIHDRAGDVVEHQSISDSILVDSYEETFTSEWNRILRHTLRLHDGSYTAMIHLVDNNANAEAIRKYTFAVRNRSHRSFQISDILLALRHTVPGPDHTVQSRTLANPTSMYGYGQEMMVTYFEVYTGELAATDSLHYQLSYIDEDNAQTFVKHGSFSAHVPVARIQNVTNTAELAPGNYQLLLQVSAPNVSVELERVTQFSVYQRPDDLRFKSYDTALRELQLIATQAEWELLANAPADERQQRLDSFWEKRDPTPNSVYNEVMSEFYWRVSGSVRYFGSDQTGSFSDRAKIYILLGQPDEISQAMSGQFQLSTVETWKYFGENRLEVIFRDESGLGDFRLVEPYSLLHGGVE